MTLNVARGDGVFVAVRESTRLVREHRRGLHETSTRPHESPSAANDHDGIKTQVKVQAAYRGFKSRVGRRRDRRAARDIQTAYRASKARFAAKVMRRRRKRLERDSNERHERSKRLQQLRGELERLKASPAELASAYATVHAKRREERLKRWRDEEAEIMRDLPGDDYVHENDVVCDYSVASSTPTKSSKEGDSVEQAMNPEENKENIALVDADDVERHTIKMYRQALSDETFAEKVAAGLAVELPPTLVGPSPDSKEEKDLRLKDLRERVERKAHERQAKSEAKGLESVVDPRGTPVMNFGEPLKWIPSKKFKRRPMVASLPVWKSTSASGARWRGRADPVEQSLLKKAQEAEEQGRDGDEAIQAEMKPFMDQAREELGKKTPEKAPMPKKQGYTPGFVNAKGEHVGVTLDSSGTTGAQKTYVEYFQARARARELMVAKKATDPEREKMRSERAKILKRAQGLVKRLQNPPKIELSESLGEPADLDLNDPEEGSDDPRGWWRLPPAGEDRDRALQAHKNAVEAHENRDKWFYASVPEDASTVGIDIRKAGQPNVPWPFPSKHLKNVPGPEPMDPDTASLYWWNWARKGLDDDIDKRTEKLLEHAEKQARALDLSDEGTAAAVVAARCKVVNAANASKATLREHSEALLERVRLGPAGRLLQAREHVKERRKHVDRLAEQYKLYLLGQKLLGKKAGPSPWAEKKDTSSDKLRERYLIQLQAWWRGQGYRRRTFREKRDRRVVNALATLVAELGGDASGVAAAASGLSDVFSQRKKAAPPPRVPPSAARVSRATSAVRFSSDEAPPLSRPPSVASSRRPSVESVPEAAPPSPSPRPSVDEVADEPPASQESSARPTPRQQLFAETPAVVQERSAKVRAAEASAQASEERRRNATGAKRLADPSATGPPRL